MCIMIIVLVMGASISIPFKKNKLTKPTPTKTGLATCSCSDSPLNNECILTIDNPNGRNEFFTVQILGAGAAGSSEKGGAAGEAKSIVYPTLNGQFLVKLGKGGVYGGTNANGGHTILYKITDDGKYEILEFAKGGTAHNEKLHTSELHDDSLAARETEGKRPDFGTGNIATSCGAGGNAGQNGKDGEVIIRW